MPCFGPCKCRLLAQPFGECQSCNEGKIKTWGADHCRLVAPKGCSKVPRPSKLQTREDPCHQRNEEICTFGTLGVQGKIRPRKGREEEGVRSRNYKKKEEEEKLKKEKEKLLKSRKRGGYFKGREESKRRCRSCR